MTGRGNYSRTVRGFGSMFKKRRKSFVPCGGPYGRHRWSDTYSGAMCVECGKTRNQVAKERRANKKAYLTQYPDGVPKQSGWNWSAIFWIFILWLFVMVVLK